MERGNCWWIIYSGDPNAKAKKDSPRPGSNQRPQDNSLFYSLALFQLSYGENCFGGFLKYFMYETRAKRTVIKKKQKLCSCLDSNQD